uniref:Uncharacterized protein n=1 Tax=Graphocephala atropunctata TaxID=36148 RepID=A0A1B6L6D2_9HEMI
MSTFSWFCSCSILSSPPHSSIMLASASTCVPAILSMLLMPSSTTCKDPQVIQVVLDGINNMLKMAGTQVEALANMIEECGGLDKIEQLQNHENVDIYKLAYDIIEQYFSELEEDVNLAPQSSEGGFQFDPNTGIPSEGFKF